MESAYDSLSETSVQKTGPHQWGAEAGVRDACIPRLLPFLSLGIISPVVVCLFSATPVRASRRKAFQGWSSEPARLSIAPLPCPDLQLDTLRWVPASE